MSNTVLLVLSIIILLSSFEKLEIIVHNEEVLLALCFISFIFFAYSYLSDSVYEDFQKKVETLEGQLFSVISERFNSILAHFDELFLFKSLEAKLSIIENLLYSRIFFHFFSFQQQALKDRVSSLITGKLMEVVRAEAKIVEEIQKKTMKSVLVSLILPASSFDYLKPLKQAMLADDSKVFFAKVSTIAKLA
tara:strand:+ start:2509 stop:3084 length:576 start_codon:yes stop_codon:yes gene_type:complete